MIKKVKHFFQKNTVLISSILFLVLFSGTMQLFAADPPPLAGGYLPGDSLDPGCAPGSVDCVVAPTIYNAIDILYNNTTSGLVATDVQAAIDLIDGVVDGINDFTIDANNNMFAGIEAGAGLTLGTENYFIGVGAGGSTTTGSYNTVYGLNALFSNTTGSSNIANGLNALYTNTTGGDNIAIGNYALYSNIIGNNNISLGGSALNSNKTGSGATAIGYNAMLYSNDTLIPFINSNVAVGYEALRGSSIAANNTGNYNTALGYQTLTSNTAGNSNTANGSEALSSNTTGHANTATGVFSLRSNISGDKNTANGYRALSSNTTGPANTATGVFSLRSNISGDKNTANGYRALMSNTGSSNTAVGSNALFSNTIGNYNTALGEDSLFSNTTGSYNTAIGYMADVTVNNLTNTTAIGYNAKVGASNSLVLGGTGVDAVKVGIGITTPTNVLDIVGAALDTTVVSISTTGGNTCNFDTGPNPGVWSCASDRRLKNSIVSIDNKEALSEINELNPVMFHYNWQESSDPLVPGFIAQEFEEIFPNMVSTDLTTGYKSLSYTPLIPYTVKAIQELDLKVEDLIIEKQNLFSNLISWFGNVGNGIEKLFVKEVNTEKMCIKKSDGTEICITGDELEQMLSTSGTSGSLDPVPTPTQVLTPDPIQTPESDPEPTLTEEPVPNPEPAPEIPATSPTDSVPEI